VETIPSGMSLPNGKTTPTGANKSKEDKKKRVTRVHRWFSANVAKSKAVKKMIEKLDILEIKPSSRRYPAIFWPGSKLVIRFSMLKNFQDLWWRGAFKDIDLNLAKGDKIIVYSKDSRATSLFMILSTIRQRRTLELSIGSHNHSKLPSCRIMHFLVQIWI
jgi:ATPase subunit of ABC transporter with duplicated ATPase domains